MPHFEAFDKSLILPGYFTHKKPAFL